MNYDKEIEKLKQLYLDMLTFSANNELDELLMNEAIKNYKDKTWVILTCDQCKKTLKTNKKSFYDAMIHATSNYDWFFGGCSTTLLCSEHKDILIKNGWIEK